MTPSKKAKACGLKDLQEMAALSNKSVNTLKTWFKTNPELFDVVLSGCITKRLNESLKECEE